MQELVSLLNGVEVPGFLTLRTFLMKVIGSVATVASSLPTGYQGVLLHIGGMIAYQLSVQFPPFELSEGPKKVAKGAKQDVTHCMASVQATSALGVYSSVAQIPVSNWRSRLGSHPLLGPLASGAPFVLVLYTY